MTEHLFYFLTSLSLFRFPLTLAKLLIRSLWCGEKAAAIHSLFPFSRLQIISSTWYDERRPCFWITAASHVLKSEQRFPHQLIVRLYVSGGSRPSNATRVSHCLSLSCIRLYLFFVPQKSMLILSCSNFVFSPHESIPSSWCAPSSRGQTKAFPPKWINWLLVCRYFWS